MTITPATTVTEYALSGTNVGPFATVFPFETTADVRVMLQNGATWTLLSAPGDYSVSAPSPLVSGGSVTLSAALVPPVGGWVAGTTLVLSRATAGDQPSAFGEAAGFSPANDEAALDHIARQVQDLLSAVGRLTLTSQGYDADGHRLGNLAAGVFGADAATLGQVQALLQAFSPAQLVSWPVFTSLAAATAATLAAAPGVILGGHTVFGDAPVSFYAQVAAMPAHQARFQSADGKWFALVFGDGVDIRQTGAPIDGASDATAALVAALSTGAAVVIPAMTFSVNPAQAYYQAAGQEVRGLNGETSVLKMRSAPATADGLLTGQNLAGLKLRNLVLDANNLIGAALTGIPAGFFNCDDLVVEGVTVRNADLVGVAANSCDRATIRRNRLFLPALLGVRLVSLTAGSGGTASQTNLSALVTGGAPNRIEQVLYDTTAGGAVTNVRFQHVGRGYTVAGGAPTVTFPAVPSASCVVALAGTAVYAVLGSSSSKVGADWVIEDNIITGGVVDIATFNARIRRNHIKGFLFGAGVTTEQSAGVGANIVEDNLIELAGLDPVSNLYMGPDVNNTVPHGVELWGAGDAAIDNTCRSNADCGIDFGGAAGRVEGNACYDNGRYYLQQGGPYTCPGIALSWGNASYNANGAIVRNNKCFDNLGASGGQAYGIACSTTPPTSMNIEGNACVGNRVQDYKFYNAQLASFRGRQLQASVIWNPGAITTGSNASTTLTVAGLDFGTRWLLDFQHTGSSNLNLNKIVYSPSGNVAQVVLCNNSGGTLTAASGTLMVSAEEFSTFYN